MLTAHERRTGLVVALGGLLAVLDTTIVAVAMPQLLLAYDTSVTNAQWIATGYTLALVGSMPLAAWVSGRWGARRVYMAALIVFAVASMAAGLAPGLGWLITARVAQGLAGGLITPIGMAIAFDAVPPDRRGRITAITGLPLIVGPIAGPILGGVLLETGSWRSIFFVTIAPALLGALAARWWITPDSSGRNRPAADVPGAMLLVPGVVLVAYGIGAEGTTPLTRLVLFGVGALLGAAFVVRSLSNPSPLLRVGLLRDPIFGRGAAVLALYAAPYFGSMLLLPIYVQVLRGDSALVSAALTLPGAIGMGLSLQVAARLIERFGATRVVSVGLSLAILAGASLVIVLRPDTPYVVLGLIAFVQGSGTGAIMMPTMASATRNLSGPDLSSGSSILPLVSTLANGLGTVAVMTLFSITVVWQAGGGLDSMSFAASSVASPVHAAAVAGAVDAYRITTAAAVAVMILALTVRLRGGRHQPPVNSDDQPDDNVPLTEGHAR